MHVNVAATSFLLSALAFPAVANAQLPPGVTLQPIDGGANYYTTNGFTYAAAPNFTWTTTAATITGLGWDDPRWFPIGPWQGYLLTSADSTRWAQLGWNTAWVPTGNSLQSVAGPAGIAVVQSYEILGGTALPEASISGTTLTLGSSATLTTGEAIYGQTVAAGTTIETGGTGTTFTVNTSQTVATTVLYAGGSQIGPAWTPGTETVGLQTYDEPEYFSQGVYTPLNITANTLQNNRFWWLNNTWNWVAFAGTPGLGLNCTGIAPSYGPCPSPNDAFTNLSYLVPTPNATTRHVDVGTLDAYWFAGSNSAALTYQAAVIYNTNGNGSGTPNATADQTRRGFLYGDMIDAQRTYQAGQYPAPIWGIVENGGPYSQDMQLSYYIQPPELNWAVWQSIIHGARGIVYFNYTPAGPYQADDNMADGWNAGTAYSAVWPGQTVSMFAQTQATDALVQQLAPVINSSTALGYVTVSPASGEIQPLPPSDMGTLAFSGIDVMAKYYTGAPITVDGVKTGSGFYIFASTRNSENDTDISATFTVVGPAVTKVTVVGENRTVRVSGNVFTDVFANAWTVHIYHPSGFSIVQQ